MLLRHAFGIMQRPDGSAVWLRLSSGRWSRSRGTGPAAVIAGAHWVAPPAEGARIALAYQGPVAPEAEAAFEVLRDGRTRRRALALTSPDRLHAGWLDRTAGAAER